MPTPIYTVELIPVPWNESIEQLDSNDLISLGGDEAYRTGQIAQTLEDADKKLGWENEDFVLGGTETSGWTKSTDATTPTADTINFLTGGSSVKFGKSGTTEANITYSKSVSPPYNLLYGYWIWIYITDKTKLENSATGFFIQLSGSGGYRKLNVHYDALHDGWNRIGDKFSNWSQTGIPTSITTLIISMNTVNAATTITHGDIKLDSFRYQNDHTLLDSCDATTGWTVYSADTIAVSTSTDRIQGTNSLQGGKDGTASQTFGYYKTFTTFDLTDSALYLAIYASSDFVSKLSSMLIQIEDSSNYWMNFVIDDSEISVGWNYIKIDVNHYTNIGGGGTIDLTDIDYFLIRFIVDNTSDLIADGDFKFDFIFYRDYDFVDYVGQSFKLDKGMFVDTIVAKLAVNSNWDITGSVITCELGTLSGQTWTTLATADNENPTSSTPAEFTFNISPHLYIPANTTRYIRFEVTGSGAILSGLDYYNVRAKETSNPYTNGGFFDFDKDGYSSISTTDDLYFKVNYGEVINLIMQSFTFPQFITEVLEVKIYSTKVGSPIDNVIMSLYDENKVKLIEAPELFNGTGEASFTFSYVFDPDTKYYFGIERTGTPDANDYWRFDIHWGSDAYIDGNLEYSIEKYPSDEFINESDIDFKFKLTRQVIYTGEDIVDDVDDMIINIGTSNTTGEVIKGNCDISLKNKTGKYNFRNPSSPLFGLFNMLQKIQVSVEYNSIQYYLFTGYITRNKPDLLFKNLIAHIFVEDEFLNLDKEEVSIGLQTTKTAPQLIEALLIAAGLEVDDYILDSDDDALKTVTWNDVNVMEKIKDIIETGQHNHFIDGLGRYIFKNNQWLIDNTPKYTFLEKDLDDAEFDDDLNTIRNRVLVNYAATYKTAEDINSQNQYGIFEHTINQVDLMPTDGVYAQAIADYVLDLDKEPGTKFSFTLKNRYPEIVDITFGDRIRIINTDLGVDEIYVVQRITHRINAKDISHEVDYDCRKWVAPPAVSPFYTITPLTGDQYLDLNADTIEAGQSFRVTSNGYPYNITLNLKHNLDVNRSIRVKLFTADGSGFPTGAQLAQSNIVIIPAGDTSGVYEFAFDVSNRPLLSTGTDYIAVVETPKTVYVSGGDPGAIIISGNQYIDIANNREKQSQSFTAPENLDMENVEIPVYFDLGTTAVDLYAYIYNESGDLPTGSPLATSDAISKSGSGYETLQFVFPTPPSLTSGNKYCVVIDTPNTTISGDTNQPFTGNTWIESEQCCTDGLIFEMRQEFFVPQGRKINQIDLEIDACSENTILKIYEGQWNNLGTLKATSDAVSNGQFTFPGGQRPVLNNENYVMIFEVPAACKTVDGIRVKGRKDSSYWGETHHFAYRCNGGFMVGRPTWDMQFKLYYEDYEINNWKLWGSTSNPYAGGRAGYYISSWALLASGVDFAFTFNYAVGVTYTYVNEWKIWGEDDDPYANGKASEKLEASGWVTKHPWDYYFSLRLINE